MKIDEDEILGGGFVVCYSPCSLLFPILISILLDVLHHYFKQPAVLAVW